MACPNCSTWLVDHRFRRRARLPSLRPRGAAAGDLPELRRRRQSWCRSARAWSGCRRRCWSAFPARARWSCRATCFGGVTRLRLELEAIARGEVDIVIGTQLVAKGHNFPGLSLVGVVDADLGLAHGDPRAAERTFQLLTQVTGRAGRAGQASRGLLQTYAPEHPVVAGARLRRPRAPSTPPRPRRGSAAICRPSAGSPRSSSARPTSDER